MSDKKIVDDYYSQGSENLGGGINLDKKPKLHIKGKVKIKKESQNEDILGLQETKNISILQDDKQLNNNKIDPNLVQKKIIENKPKVILDKKVEKIIGDNIQPRKEYTTKIGLEKQTNKGSYSTGKSSTNVGGYKTKQNNKDKPTTIDNKDNGVKKIFSNTNNNEGGFKIHEGKKDVKFGFKKTAKTFDDKSEDKSKKLFKKDKSNKYAKNILIGEDDFSFSRSNKIKHVKKEEKNIEDIKQNLTDHSGETVIVGDILSVKELSEKIGIPLMKLITEFMKNGMKVTINSKIDFDTATIVCDTFNIKLQKDISSGFQVEDMLTGDISALLIEEDKSLLTQRAPIISIMGHVDHGKTSLLDYIRKTKVADKEAGGITQSIGAYQVEYNNEKITFLDTPGHEAFTIMRARGAKSTDIAVLVVAADEGVKPQTIESINHAREAGIQIIVAINKMDKPGANVEFVKGQLAQQGLQPEDWGGTTPMIPVSAKTGLGIDDLLEIIILSSQMLELKANPNRLAVGTILESHLDMKLGPVSTVLINTGTLRKGDCLVCKGSYGKVKVMKDYHSKNIVESGPSTPVLVVGLDNVCEGGDIVQVVSDIEKARIKALEYKELMASRKAIGSSSIDLIMSKIKSGNLKQLKAVLKADTNGSLEAIKGALIKLSTPETKITIIHSGVGNITEGDVLMCQGSSALLIGFNVELLGNTRNIIEDTKVEYISSKVIYHITERVEKIVTGMLDPKEIEIALGEAIVAGIFYEAEGFMILGLKLKADSKIEKNASVKVIRKDKFIGDGKIENLKSGIIDVQDLEGPIECGIKFKTNTKVEMGDLFEIYKIEIQK
ncbi:MAG: translation initiation factor IF-2 [Candidatus Gracilibacteria bacterium]|nr:translation initiation factor IF-2 [Candidatus Gracilibacteria bacterium]